MKTILITMLSLTLTLGANAQHKVVHPIHTRIYVTPYYGFGFGYPYGYFGNPFFGYPYSPYALRPHYPTRVEQQVQQIRSSYRYKIKAARKDKTVTKDQRKQEVLALKSEREKDIMNAQMNYHNGRMNNRSLNNNNNNGNSGTNDDQNSSTE